MDIRGEERGSRWYNLTKEAIIPQGMSWCEREGKYDLKNFEKTWRFDMLIIYILPLSVFLGVGYKNLKMMTE